MRFFVGGGASRTYTDEQVAGLLDAAPGALDTLNELAAALNDDANFASTITNSLASAVTTAAADATAKADAAEAAALAALTARIDTKADPTAVWAGGYDTLGQMVFVESESALWILAGGTDGSVSGNWSALVRGSTVGSASLATSYATASTVDDAVGSLISPFLLAGM